MTAVTSAASNATLVPMARIAAPSEHSEPAAVWIYRHWLRTSAVVARWSSAAEPMLTAITGRPTLTISGTPARRRPTR